MLLKNKVALVTGATRGIGKAIVKKLCTEGAAVVGIYQRQTRAAQELESELTGQGYRVSFYQGSVSETSFVATVMKEIYNQYGSIDILVNNASIVRDSFIAQMPAGDWEDVFCTNYLGTFICSTEVLPYMLKQGAGKVVNIVSVSGIWGREAQTNYSTSKGAIIGLTKLLSREYAGQGIYFNALAPGLVETEMIQAVPEHKRESMLEFTNLKRVGKPEEIANAVFFLSSNLSDYCINTVVKIDGGMMR